MLLATCINVENAEEPWTAKILPLLTGLGMLDSEISKKMFLTYITELFNETTLLRSVSFRPDDVSTIWAQKNHEEIFHRFTKMSTRSDVEKYKRVNNPTLILNLTEVLPFIKYFFEIMPNTKLLHVIRNYNDVAYDCILKGWFSDSQLLNPVKALPYSTYKIQGKTWYLPWWVKEDDEDMFIRYNEYERCVYYWCQNIEVGINEINKLDTKCKCKTIHYEKLISNVNGTFEEIISFLDLKPGQLTQSALDRLKKREILSNDKNLLPNNLQQKLDLINSSLY